MFESYEEDYTQAAIAINKCVSDMARYEGKRDQQKAIVSQGVSHANEADQMIKQMDLQARQSAPSAKQSMQDKIRRYKT